MKTILAFLAFASFALAGPEPAPPTAPPASPQDWLTFIQGVSNAHALTLAVAPTYASKLTSKWGASIEAGYPINDYLEVLLRGDILDNSYFAMAGGAKLKVDFQLFGHNVTPYVETMAVSPVSNGGSVQGDVGALVGSGMRIEVWKTTDAKLSLSALGEVDYITYYPGVQIYRVGAQAVVHF